MTVPDQQKGHGKPYAVCGARKRAGGICTLKAGWGTDHVGFGSCRKHGGNTRNHRKQAEQEHLREAARKLGVPKDVDVETAMLDLIREAAGNVDFYRSLVQELEQDHGGLTQLDGGGEKSDGRRVPFVLVAMYNEERDRLQRYLKEAASLGIQQRKLDMAQDDARRIVSVLRGVIGDLELPAEKMALLPGLVRRHMEAIAATAVEVG